MASNEDSPVSSGLNVKDPKLGLMLSYNHQHKDIVNKIKDQLRQQGHDVWIDSEKMVGSISQTMEEAVRNAGIVLICLSRKYEKSANCKIECDCILKYYKTFVALIMEDFEIDESSWLKPFKKKNLYVNFTDEEKFEGNFKELTRVLNLTKDNILKAHVRSQQVTVPGSSGAFSSQQQPAGASYVEKQIVCYVSNVSQIETSKNYRKYFVCNLQTKSNKKRGVCFSPEKRSMMIRFQEKQVLVKIENFKISDDKSQDVLMNYKTQLSETALTGEDLFMPITVPRCTITSIALLKDATPEQLVTVKANVFSLTGVKKVRTGNNIMLNKQEGILVDPTGQTKIVLWEDNVDSLESGKTYILKNIRVKDYNGDRYVNPPKGDKEYEIRLTDDYQLDELPKVETPLDTTVQATGNIYGVKKITKYKACFNCGTMVTERKKGRTSHCRKCDMTVKTDSCTTAWNMQIRIEATTPTPTKLQLYVFNNEVELLTSLCRSKVNINTCTEEDLEDEILNLPELRISYDRTKNNLLDCSIAKALQTQ